MHDQKTSIPAGSPGFGRLASHKTVSVWDCASRHAARRSRAPRARAGTVINIHVVGSPHPVGDANASVPAPDRRPITVTVHLSPTGKLSIAKSRLRSKKPEGHGTQSTVADADAGRQTP